MQLVPGYQLDTSAASQTSSTVIINPSAFKMVSLRNLVVAVAGTTAALAAPTTDLANRAHSELAKRLTVTESTTGTSGGYYYSCYIESDTGATMTIGDGTYSLSWSSSSEDVVAGIGWSTGSAR